MKEAWTKLGSWPCCPHIDSTIEHGDDASGSQTEPVARRKAAPVRHRQFILVIGWIVTRMFIGLFDGLI